jgi:hypothetical protein
MTGHKKCKKNLGCRRFALRLVFETPSAKRKYTQRMQENLGCLHCDWTMKRRVSKGNKLKQCKEIIGPQWNSNAKWIWELTTALRNEWSNTPFVWIINQAKLFRELMKQVPVLQTLTLIISIFSQRIRNKRFRNYWTSKAYSKTRC